MFTQTLTFPIKITSNYVPGSHIEICHFRNLGLEEGDRAAVYLEMAQLTLNVRSMKKAIVPKFDGDETEEQKLAKFNAAEEKSERFGLKISSRKNNIGEWDEDVELIVVNRGRKDYTSALQPWLTLYQVRILEVNDAFSISLVDYGYGLLKNADNLKLTFGVKIEISKKNDIDALNARIAAIELALEGRLINLAANSLLGRNASVGTVEAIPISNFATPAMIDQAITDLAGGAPGALNTLIELANALNNDANFATTVTNALATKANLNGAQTFSGIKTFANRIIVFDLMLADDPYVTITTNIGKGYIKAAPDFYEDYKVGINGYIRFRCGAGGETGFTRGFMLVRGSNGEVTFNSNIFVLGSTINFGNIPTSAANLSPGSLYRTGNVVNIA